MQPITARWLANLTVPGRPDEHEVKQLLAAHGLRTPRGRRLAVGAGLPPLSFSGPYALKVCSPDIVHKTEQRGVRLNIAPEEISAAVDAMARSFPGAALLVEEMIGFEGPEMIAGGLMDPVLGAAVMVGAGGILTEIAPDVAFRLAPLDPPEARRMLAELRIAPVFQGFRGLTLDADALARLVATASGLIDELGARFDQLDLNPIVWNGAEWVVLDARLMLAVTPPVAAG